MVVSKRQKGWKKANGDSKKSISQKRQMQPKQERSTKQGIRFDEKIDGGRDGGEGEGVKEMIRWFCDRHRCVHVLEGRERRGRGKRECVRSKVGDRKVRE